MMKEKMQKTEYVDDIMLDLKIEILVAKEYNENIVFRDNWGLYGISNIINDVDINNHRLYHHNNDRHIAIVSDFDEDNFSWNYMISALKQQFEDKLKEQQNKYDIELNLLKDEIIKLKGGNVRTNDNDNDNDIKIQSVIKYEINQESAKRVKSWLESMTMSIYYDLFIENGFDSILMIKQINNRQELMEIGVEMKAHQYTLMNGIAKLKQ